MQLEIDEDGCHCPCKRGEPEKGMVRGSERVCDFACGEASHVRDYLGVVNLRLWCNNGKLNHWISDGMSCPKKYRQIRYGQEGYLWYYKSIFFL